MKHENKRPRKGWYKIVRKLFRLIQTTRRGYENNRLRMLGRNTLRPVQLRVWHDSCKTYASIKDDDATSVAIRKATDSITSAILHGCCIKVIWDLYNK